MSEIIQLAGVVASTVATLFGFGAVRSSVLAIIRDRTVPLEDYKAKVKELHDLRNADREELVALRSEVKVLREHYERSANGRT